MKEKPLMEKNSKQISWEEVRAQFRLDDDFIHIGAAQFIATHPQYVNDAIDHYRLHLDQNPAVYTLDNEKDHAQDVRIAAARYLAMDNPDNIALTDSTTMGLGILYTGLDLQKGKEILTTNHNHYSHQESIKQATDRTGAAFRVVRLYENLPEVTEEEMVDSIVKEITDKTRVLGLTWVHSDTGLKIPVSKIAGAVSRLNKQREEKMKILLLIDGVHGFGIETETFPELGCDFFITSGHKWLYGPRGTGLIAARSHAWQHVRPVIPSYNVMNLVVKKRERRDKIDGREMTPGGFHSLEHRWALAEAFEFMEKLGKERVYKRVHELNRQCKEGLASIRHVKLHTPMEDHLSAGIIAFEVKGMETKNVIKRLREKKIVATEAPYRSSYARITPGIFNTPEEINKVLDAIQSLQ